MTTHWIATGVVLLGVVAAAGLAGEGKEADLRLRIVPHELDAPRFCSYGMENRLRVGEATNLGAYEVRLEEERGRHSLAWQVGDRSRSASLSRKKDTQVVSVGEGKEKLRVLLHCDRFGRWYWLNANAVKAKVGGRWVLFQDMNFDGDFLDPGADWYGWLRAGCAVPVGSPLILGALSLTPVASECTEKRLAFRVRSLTDGWPEATESFCETLNDARLAFGLVPCDVDRVLSEKYCRRHVEWMRVNGRGHGHAEPEGSPGYSPEGRIGAANCGISHRSGARAAFDLFDPPLHGYPLASPAYSRMALWSDAEVNATLAWIFQKRGMEWPPTGARWPAAVPPHGAKGVPVSWYAERPDPRRGDPNRETGYPIKLYLSKTFPYRGPFPTELSSSLRRVGAREDEPVQAIYNAETAFRGLASGLPILLLPERVLATNSEYVLDVRWTLRGRPGRWRSSFRTGSQHGQLRSELELE